MTATATATERPRFRRAWAVTVGGLRIEGVGAGGGAEQAGLDCSFEVAKSTRREPNTLTLKIWNLAPQQRRQIESGSTLGVRVEAGYVGDVSTLFDGDVRVAQSRARRVAHRSVSSRLGTVGQTREDVDIITEIEAEDGGTAWRTATVQRAYPPRTPVATVLRDAVRAMGIGAGNLDDLGRTVGLAGGDVRTYAEGTALSGLAHREVDRIVRSCGLSWSVQSGVLQLRRGREALATTAVVLSPTTGLAGSPAPDAEGYVNALSLMNGGLYPGRPVVLRSREVEGSYQVRRVEHTGDTAGGDWYSAVTLEAR